MEDFADSPTSDPEVLAIAEAYQSLEELPREAQARVIRYLIARFGLADSVLSGI